MPGAEDAPLDSNRIRDDDTDDLAANDLAFDDRNKRRARSLKRHRESTPQRPNGRPTSTGANQAFRCRKCRPFIGAPFSGSRHRNHCPNCLHSLHVDLKHPRGLVERRNGEQMILHECLGCGKTQPNRVAAEDNPIALIRLRPIGLLRSTKMPELITVEEVA